MDAMSAEAPSGELEKHCALSRRERRWHSRCLVPSVTDSFYRIAYRHTTNPAYRLACGDASPVAFSFAAYPATTPVSDAVAACVPRRRLFVLAGAELIAPSEDDSERNVMVSPQSSVTERELSDVVSSALPREESPTSNPSETKPPSLPEEHVPSSRWTASSTFGSLFGGGALKGAITLFNSLTKAKDTETHHKASLDVADDCGVKNGAHVNQSEAEIISGEKRKLTPSRSTSKKKARLS